MAVYQLERETTIRCSEHLQTRRGLALVLRGERLTNAEAAHLEGCHICNEWLTTFTGLGRKVGFPIRFRIPPCWAGSPKRTAGGSFFGSNSTHSESAT
jgi:hypothetical protein